MPSSNGGERAVADTSPILNLGLVDQLDLLADQFDLIDVPEAVRDELLAGEAARERLRSFLERDVVSVIPVERTDLVREFRSELDAGEAAAIALTIETDADLVLIDERDGRTVARRHDLPVTGVVGILLRAARSGTVDVEAALSDLRDAGFWIGDDLYKRAIDSVRDASDS